MLTFPAGLCAWLNERKVPICLPLNPPAEQPAPPPAAPVAAAAPCRTAADIEDFLLNAATVSEVERIFSAIGTRFAENRGAASRQAQPLPPA